MNARTARHDVAQLFSKYHCRVRSNLTHWGLSPADADELCAEVFIVAMARLDSFQGHSSISTWLIGIARNLAMDQRRSARSRKEVLSACLPEHATERGADDELERLRRDAAVRKAVQALKPTQRAVVKGYLFDERPMNVVALRSRVPVQTAYARLYAAQASLKTAMGEALAA